MSTATGSAVEATREGIPANLVKNQALGIQRAAGEDSISQLRNPLPFGAT